MTAELKKMRRTLGVRPAQGAGWKSKPSLGGARMDSAGAVSYSSGKRFQQKRSKLNSIQPRQDA
jgi:hypothetical protein